MEKIQNAVVVGAGVMGATIAAHLTNAGLDVLLLDIVPEDLNENDAKDRNRFANNAVANLSKSKPAAFYLKKNSKRITPGNLEDDIQKISNYDWIIEVVLENMEIKKQLFTEKILPNLSKNAILTTNTSGLSINDMAKILPPEIRKRFLITHFFNPPRYMRLVEIVPCDETDPEVTAYLSDFISRRLGKGIVLAKDTTNFIANRIGVYSISIAMKHMLDMKMTVEEVDMIAGTPTGRPKSAVFRTADIVGIDTLARIGENTYHLLENDEAREIFKVPDFVQEMVGKGLIGDKSSQGFYKKTRIDGKREILYYDYVKGDYVTKQKPRFASIGAAKQIDDVGKRIKVMVSGTDKAAEFAWVLLRDVLIYTINRIPEISDDIVQVDHAMKWGFNWDLGPFEMLDALGISYFIERVEKEGGAIPKSLKGVESFYKIESGKRHAYNLVSRKYESIEAKAEEINFEILKKSGGVVETKPNWSLLDLGDGVFGFEFHSKMNTLSGDILGATLTAIKHAEKEGVGLVIGNQGVNFSAGANLMMLVVAIAEGEFDDIDLMIRSFQKATMAIKYAKIPVVVAPFNLTLGGGCEYALHAASVVAYAETYMGLVEIGAGLLPAGGGTKEMCLRSVELAEQNQTDPTPFIFKRFQNIGLAKVSMSGDELFEMGYLRQGDSITMNFDRLISDAKARVLSLAANYRPKTPITNIKAPGRSIAASIKSQLWNMAQGQFATEYEYTMGSVIADVICGGDVPGGTLISEQYLLELEREGFLRLCGNKKTSERLQHILKTGKPLRN